MAKKTNNFKKFGKLASLVKKIADKNPELKQQILDESESKIGHVTLTAVYISDVAA